MKENKTTKWRGIKREVMEGRRKKKKEHSIYCKLRFDVKHLSEQTYSEDINTMGQIRFVFYILDSFCLANVLCVF